MNLEEATIKALSGKLIENKKQEARSNKARINNKKVTEATTDVNEVYDEYKKAYHKDLDLKTVPCVIARDKMLSGWGGAEGKTHYQVVLCADRDEADNIAHNMQAIAKREQLANVRMSFGVKLPSKASVAYVVGRYAPAWNMGDNWYARYDTDEKKEETKSIKVKGLRKLEGIRAVEEYEYEFDDLYDIVGENGKSVLDDIRNANKEDEFIDYLISIMGEDIGKLPTVGELSDFIDYDYETIFRDLEMKTENKKKTEVKNKKLENIQGNNQGICPKCGSMITNYGHIFWDDEGIGQEFNCTNPECKAHGTEYYNTTFDYIEAEEN